MRNIDISVINKLAELKEKIVIVCDNSDYQVTFIFDSEWDEHYAKTARFSWMRNGEPGYTDVVFTGNVCAIPKLHDICCVYIGVYAGDLKTSTNALVICLRSALSGGGLPEDPSPDVYAQIIDLIEEGVSDEQIALAVEKYMEENPIDPGVQFETDETLTLENGILSVNTTDEMERDNTLPITSGGVYTVVGNIGAILDTI